jgi:hypothetical protein
MTSDRTAQSPWLKVPKTILGLRSRSPVADPTATVDHATLDILFAPAALERLALPVQSGAYAAT